MKKQQDLIVNRPLSNTYGWLHLNGTSIPPFQAENSFQFVWKPAPHVREGDVFLEGVHTGMGLDLDRLGAEGTYSSTGFTLEAGQRSLLRVDVLRRWHNGPEVGGLAFRVEEGGDFTAVLDISATGGGVPDPAALQLKALVERDAVLRLVVIQRLGEQDALLNDLGVRCQEDARFEYVRLVLGGGTTYDGCSVALEGDNSSFAADVGYRLAGREKLDMNYECVHLGRRTDCAIHAAGVLRGEADKLFRGTIDFRTGCSGSTGAETEDVLLMDETVRNRTLPVILCSEEDVDGSHGATIGRLDEGLVYYLESRGLAREEIYELCARGKIDAVVRKIPDPDTVRRLFPWLSEEAAE